MSDNHLMELAKAKVQLKIVNGRPVVEGDVDLLIEEVDKGIVADPFTCLAAWTLAVLRDNEMLPKLGKP